MALHRRGLIRWSAAALLGLVVLGCVAGRAGVIRADGLAAAACASELARPHDDLQSVLRRHREAFVSEAAHVNLPPEFLAAVVADHHAALTPFRRFTDCAGSALGRDVSLGAAQVRISTAVQIDGASFGAISNRTFQDYRARLLTPGENIRFQAKEVRDLLDRHAQSGPLHPEGLIHDPEAMARLITAYRVGRLPPSTDPDVRRASAVSTLRFLYSGSIEFVDRPQAEVARIKKGIETHLTHLNCETRNSTPQTCQEWKASLGRP